ncbi:hypothetical protein [Campylobacter peloridis]|uniref:hypothetical protein n=1 Tax=Campylobacter peloridis TaxID=488546 RepID=UPI001C73CEE1|nr:hypothetical protein [Campylobacter peloridis]MBX1886283.1 hypothetical protein [Campylobacter peloridis]
MISYSKSKHKISIINSHECLTKTNTPNKNANSQEVANILNNKIHKASKKIIEAKKVAKLAKNTKNTFLENMAKNIPIVGNFIDSEEIKKINILVELNMMNIEAIEAQNDLIQEVIKLTCYSVEFINDTINDLQLIISKTNENYRTSITELSYDTNEILKIYNELTDIVINQMQDHTKHFQEIQIKIEKNEDEVNLIKQQQKNFTETIELQENKINSLNKDLLLYSKKIDNLSMQQNEFMQKYENQVANLSKDIMQELENIKTVIKKHENLLDNNMLKIVSITSLGIAIIAILLQYIQ